MELIVGIDRQLTLFLRILRSEIRLANLVTKTRILLLDFRILQIPPELLNQAPNITKSKLSNYLFIQYESRTDSLCRLEPQPFCHIEIEIDR